LAQKAGQGKASASFTAPKRKIGGKAVQGKFKNENVARTGSDPFSFRKNKTIEAKRAANKALAAKTMDNSVDARINRLALSGVILPGVFIPKLQALSGKTFYEDNLTALEKSVPKVFATGSAKFQKKN